MGENRAYVATMNFIHTHTESVFDCDAEHDGYMRSGATFAATVHRETHKEEVTTEPQEERDRTKGWSGVSFNTL